MLSDAYAAGLVDGEGCVSIDQDGTIRVEIGMTEKALPTLLELRETYGGTVRLFRPATEWWQAAYQWITQNADAARVLERVRPWLTLKEQQAEYATHLQAMRERRKVEHRHWTEQEKADIALIRERVIALNARGPEAEPTMRSEGLRGVRLLALRVGDRFHQPQMSLLDDPASSEFSGTWPTSGFSTSRGECWTADTSEFPSGGGVSSSLRDVLEETVPDRYFLSQRAAAGILRRAEKRGRQLPEQLRSALSNLAGPADTE